jgi:hypothetical protein
MFRLKFSGKRLGGIGVIFQVLSIAKQLNQTFSRHKYSNNISIAAVFLLITKHKKSSSIKKRAISLSLFFYKLKIRLSKGAK